jgi:ADP-ribose pyrophosphatase YjhB (NUDIX family)
MQNQRKMPFSPEEFKAIYSKVPRATVEVIIKTNCGGIILIKRTESSWFGKIHIPGGTIFYKEPVFEAAKRVALEEIGIPIEPQKVIGHIEYPSEEQERGFGWSIGIAVLCTTQVIELSDDIKIYYKLPPEIIAEQVKILSSII